MPCAVVSSGACATRGTSFAAYWATTAGRPTEVSGDKGWKCRHCDALVPEREYLESVHDPDASDRPVMSHGGAAAGSHPPSG